MIAEDVLTRALLRRLQEETARQMKQVSLLMQQQGRQLALLQGKLALAASEARDLRSRIAQLEARINVLESPVRE